MITPDITRLSPNFNNGAVQGRTVIIHATRSGVSMNPSEFQGTLNYMATPGTTSSQWVISRTGTKARVVPDNLQAWHAQEDNDNSWGIELEQGVEDDGFTESQIDALVDVSRGYVENCSVLAVHCKTSTQAGFIGHQETVQGKRNGKSDPGHLFDWEDFIRRLTMPTADFLKDEARKWRGLTLLNWAIANDYQVYPSADGYSIDFWRNGEARVSLPIASVPEWWSTLPEIPA